MNRSYAISRYKKGRLCGAKPFELLMIAYNEAIWGCTTGNAPHAITALEVLIDSLARTEKSSLSESLEQSYAICMNLIQNNKLEIAANLLQSLRKTWREAYESLY